MSYSNACDVDTVKENLPMPIPISNACDVEIGKVKLPIVLFPLKLKLKGSDHLVSMH